jgi:hypothetical protein
LKIHILLEVSDYNFYWAEKGYKYKDGKPIICSWEDITYSVIIDENNLGERCATIYSKLYMQNEINELKGDFGARMEVNYNGYIEENLKTSPFNMEMKEVIKSKDILLGYYYDEFDDTDKYESDLYNLPTNEFGIKPSYIVGYTPNDNISRKVIEDFMKLFVSKHYNIDKNSEFSFEWIDTLENIEEEWNNYLKEIDEWEQMRKDGKKFRIQYAIPFLIQMYGEEVINRYIENGLKYGEPIEESTETLLTFKDGHTEILIDSDFEMDHFSEPKLPF